MAHRGGYSRDKPEDEEDRVAGRYSADQIRDDTDVQRNEKGEPATEEVGKLSDYRSDQHST